MDLHYSHGCSCGVLVLHDEEFSGKRYRFRPIHSGIHFTDHCFHSYDSDSGNYRTDDNDNGKAHDYDGKTYDYDDTNNDHHGEAV